MSVFPSIRLGDCCDIVSGATPKTGEKAYWGGEIFWVTPKDLSRLDAAYIDCTPRTITELGLRSCAATLLPARSVLFSSRAPIGHVAINTVPMATNQGFKSFVPKSDRVHPEYLLHWLRTNRSYLEGLGNGATFKEVSKAIVSRIEVPLPPPAEQRRIAEVLDRADALRAKRRTALAQLDSLTQSIFLHMFGDPATNPKAWPRTALGRLVVNGFQNGLYKHSSHYGSGTPILRIDAFYDGVVTGLDTLKRLRASASEIESYGLHEGDVVVNRVNSIEYLGKSAIVPFLPEPVVFESNMMRFAVDGETALAPYIVAFLQSGFIKSQIGVAAKQAVNQASINQTDVAAFQFNIPPLSLQQTFVSRIAAINKLKTTHRTTLTELDALFASLQHRAFRGEL